MRIALIYLCIWLTGDRAIAENANDTHPVEASNKQRLLLERVNDFTLNIDADEFGSVCLTNSSGQRLYDCQAYLASRIDGAENWDEERAAYRVVKRDDSRLVLQTTFNRVSAEVRFQRTAAFRYTVSGHLVNTSSEPLELARFHYCDGLVSDPSLNFLSLRQYELPGRLIRPGEDLRAPRAACEQDWGRAVYWPRLSEPIHDRPNTAISGDAGMFAPDWNSPGFFFGFTGPGTAFGEIGIKTKQAQTPFFLAVLLDAVLLEPGIRRPLEEAVISFGDPQDELRHWSRLCVRQFGPARISAPLVGYCSWYQKRHGIQPEDIRRAIDSFSSFAAPKGGKTIQIDDGFQVMPGDWSGRGAWKEELPKLPAEMRAKGFIPGLWLAPTAIHASHPIIKEHPEWLQRDRNGEFCIRFSNWDNFGAEGEKGTYFLEPDHPEAREFMKALLKETYAEGWRYYKIDFAYTVSTARQKYDRSKTSFQSLQSQWRLFREALGEDALINSCIGGMWRYTIGYMDVSRIGGDIGSRPEKLRKNIAEMILRCHVNGLWWQADPDVYYMRKSNFTFEQSHLLTATQGLLGTAFLTSDYGDQWDERAKEVVKRYWNKNGPRVPMAQYVALTEDGLPEFISLAYNENEFALGIYNWQENAGDVNIKLADTRLPRNCDYQVSLISYGNEQVTLKNGILCVTNQPGESLRIVRLQRGDKSKTGNRE